MSSNDRTETDAPPLVSFDPAGKAPIVSYNVPEPTSYAGRSYIELDVDEDWFSDEASQGTTFNEWIREYLRRRRRPRLLEEVMEAEESVHEEDTVVADVVEAIDAIEEEAEPRLGLAVEKEPSGIIDQLVRDKSADTGDEDDGSDEETEDAEAAAERAQQSLGERERAEEEQQQARQAAAQLSFVTEEEMELSELIAAFEEQFRTGDTGPIVGATDRRITKSVAAVGNATALVSEPATGGGSQFLHEADEPAQASLLSSVQDAVEPNLFAAGALSQAGSQPAEMATALLEETAKANDMDMSALQELQPATLARKVYDGQLPIAHYSMGGRPTIEYTVAPQRIEPRLVLVERYRLSTFLGNYGAGRTIKTFSLLPGEQTSISVETFRKTQKTRKEASSVLDSYTSETAEEFEETVKAEQSNKSEHETSFAYHAEAKAEAKWGWGSASASGGVEGSSNSAREEIAKNLSTATSKHAAEASTKREVEVDTEYEVSEETGEERAIERTLENTNLSRTLNFVFKQMNQEFVTMAHLVDVRVGFTNGGVDVTPGGGGLEGIQYREASLTELDDLLADVIDEDHRANVREMIEAELSNVFDYRGAVRSMVERVDLPGSEGGEGAYLRVDPDLTTTYTDETGNEFTVPGIVLSADKNVMRTDGIVVEALLGRGEALDGYATDLQHEEVRKRLLQNDEREATIARERLAHDVVTDGDDESADRFDRVFRHLDGTSGGDADEDRPLRPIGPPVGGGDQ